MQNGTRKVAIIIGAGPAGLTAAYELLTRSEVLPIVLEKSTYMGGISRTVEYKGNRMDIGGHRFFSKSDRVMDWWLKHMPLADPAAGGKVISYQRNSRALPTAVPAANDERVMLIRERTSRIYFLRKFFSYPIQLTPETLRNLGLARVVRIGFSYLWSALFPPQKVENLEEFFIQRFGRELYRTFFKDYTEKVWGVPCEQISAEWGAQRIKGLSILKAIEHHVRKLFQHRSDIAQKNTETSLIEQFMYPRLGPGQMWETVAERVRALGGQILTGVDVQRIEARDGRVTAVHTTTEDGTPQRFDGDFFFSTMPVKELVAGLSAPVPENVREVSDNLQYRDFITVGLLLRKLAVKDSSSSERLIKDNWIYIQESDVRAGRLQIFNNWSPYLVRDPNTVWIGVEYFCNETDDLWKMSDEAMSAFAK
ncbi:MAG TPA: NAD(P)/FAD-dependent oxidoreductase, partial [Terriglobales bacterium]